VRRNESGRRAVQRWAVVALGLLWLLLALVVVVVQYSRAPRVRLRWQTETEFDSAGFNIYRSDSPSGVFAKVNEGIVPTGADSLSGASYEYLDYDVERGERYYYRLEDVGLDGRAELSGQIEASAPEVSFWVPLLAGGCVLVGLALLFSSHLSEVAKTWSIKV
jgi:hypothetical protein